MPNIPIYNAPFPSVNVSDRGEEAYRVQAREIGALGREGLDALERGGRQLAEGISDAGKVVQQHQDYNDQITGVRTYADMKLQNQKDLNDITANTSPDEMPNALAKWQQNANDRLDQWQTQFAGSSRHIQLWATERAGEIKLETAQHMARDGAINAGNKAVSDIAHTANSIAGSLSDNPGPLEIDSALRTWDQGTQAALANPAITDPQMKARIQKDLEAQRSQFVETSIYKAVDNNPGIASSLVQRYGQYLTPQQQRSILEHSNQSTQKNFWQSRAVQQDQERQQKQDADKALSDLTRSTFAVDANGQPSGERFVPPDYFSRAMEISKMPGANEATLKAAVKDAQEIWNRTKNGVTATTDPQTYQQLFAKAYNGLTDNDVFQAHAGGKLSDHDSTMFHQAVENAARNPQMTEQKRQFDQFINTYAKGLILKSSIMNPSAWEAQRLQQFENDKWQQYQDAITKGAKPYDLLDQRNPIFIGKDVDRYQLTPDQQLKAIEEKTSPQGLKPLPPTTPARQPGESAADYLKRTGGP